MADVAGTILVELEPDPSQSESGLNSPGGRSLSLMSPRSLASAKKYPLQYVDNNGQLRRAADRSNKQRP